MRTLTGLALGVLLCWQPAAACNPQPPKPPILDGYEYDAMAREYLARDASTIALGRFVDRVDVVFEGSDTAARQSDYVFQLYQGWKAVLPARLVVPGYWVGCDLPLSRGASFLFFLDGRTPLYIVPAVPAMPDLAALGDVDWFYLPGGQLIEPDLLEGGAGTSEGGEGKP